MENFKKLVNLSELVFSFVISNPLPDIVPGVVDTCSFISPTVKFDNTLEALKFVGKIQKEFDIVKGYYKSIGNQYPTNCNPGISEIRKRAAKNEIVKRSLDINKFNLELKLIY